MTFSVSTQDFSTLDTSAPVLKIVPTPSEEHQRRLDFYNAKYRDRITKLQEISATDFGLEKPDGRYGRGSGITALFKWEDGPQIEVDQWQSQREAFEARQEKARSELDDILSNPERPDGLHSIEAEFLAADGDPAKAVPAPILESTDQVTEQPGGKLTAHGPAAYLNDADNTMSYFATLEREDGTTETSWGAHLKKAIPEAGAELGDRVDIKRVNSEPVILPSGREVQRNTWNVSVIEKGQAVEKPEEPEATKQAEQPTAEQPQTEQPELPKAEQPTPQAHQQAQAVHVRQQQEHMLRQRQAQQHRPAQVSRHAIPRPHP